ncbi:MAG: DUF2336 domain-containing protein [Alphaproteobacteria bacterium]|nr:DUF2336 domain-containing protein [Alphaproteobacteria bacterium]
MTDLPHIPNLNSLVELGRRDGVDIRPTLLRVMTDLYVQTPTHTPEEERHFTELALRLIELVDPATRAVVADRIAGYPTAPAAVRQRLLRDQIVLGPPADDVRPTAGNTPSGGGAAAELSELFFAATAEERRLILLNLPYAPLLPTQAIPAAAAREATARLETAALGHDTQAFVRELERSLRVSHRQARRIVEDASGEPIVVAAVALGMPEPVLQRILLCLNPAVSRSVQRVYDLAVLQEEIEPEAALRLLAIWQTSNRPEPAAKAPAPVAARAPAAAPVPRRAEVRERAVPPARPVIKWEEHAKARRTDNA